MKKCLRQKCGKEFEPTKPKQVYCSTKCRTYAHREKNAEPPTKREEVKKTQKVDISGDKAKMPAGMSKSEALRWMRENS